MYRRMMWTNPWNEMARMTRDMNRLMEQARAGSFETTGFPAVNVWANEESQIVTAELPGMTSEDLKISVLGDTLTISGERCPAELEEGAHYQRRERGCGSFTRAIQLPYTVDADRVEASFEKGVLTLVLPRAEADKPRKIVVRSK